MSSKSCYNGKNDRGGRSMKQVSDFAQIPLGLFPTPMHRLDNISRRLGVDVWLKRDDLSGVALGGNKVRKLEFLLAEARAQGAEIVMTTGGAQSNHALLTAACAKRLGMEPILVLKRRGVTARRGNQYLEYLMGTEVHFVDTDDYADIYAEMDRIGEARGRPYYKIPCGGSNALGALGYVKCAEEIARSGQRFDHILCAEGSGGTHAGLALGAKLFLPDTQVTGVMVDSDPFAQITPALMNEAAALLELPLRFGAGDVHLLDMCGSGYALPSPEGERAQRLMAEQEGLFLDPVYTAKAFAGLLRMAQESSFAPGARVLFLFSGGAGGLFAAQTDEP